LLDRQNAVRKQDLFDKLAVATQINRCGTNEHFMGWLHKITLVNSYILPLGRAFWRSSRFSTSNVTIRALISSNFCRRVRELIADRRDEDDTPGFHGEQELMLTSPLSRSVKGLALPHGLFLRIAVIKSNRKTVLLIDGPLQFKPDHARSFP